MSFPMKKERIVISFGTKVLAVLFACVCMWGCGNELKREWGPVEWSSSRVVGGIIGFIDDSLTVVSDWRLWSQEQEDYVYGGATNQGTGHQGLRVYNYRVQEDGPRWTDTLDNENTENFTYLKGQLSDSVIWGGNGVDSFSFWKLGEKPAVKNVSIVEDGCKIKFKQEALRVWLDETIFMKGPLGAGGDSCQYAILDTAAGMLTYKRLDNVLEWLKACDDVRAWGDDVYCLSLDKTSGNSVILKNGVDSIFAPMDKIYEGCFSGDMIELGVRICSLKKDEITCSDVKWTGNRELEFYRNDGTVIHLE